MRDRLLGRERNRNAGAERLAPHGDATRIALRRERIGGARVLDQAGFGRRAARAAIAAVAERQQPDALRDDPPEAIDAQVQRAAVAVEIEHHRLAVARRHMPREHTFAVRGTEPHFLRLRKSGGGRRRARAIGEIHQRALREEHQRAKADIGGGRDDEYPFKSGHRKPLNAKTNVRD